MKTKLFVTVLGLACFFALKGQAAADTGTLKNNTRITMYYQAGYKDANGYISWQTYKLLPGQAHLWTVQNPQRYPLYLQWDLVMGDGKFGPTVNVLPVKPRGYVSAFFVANGNQIWIDTSANPK